MSVFHSIWLLIRAMFRNRAELAIANLALRQQLAFLKKKDQTAEYQATRPSVVGMAFPVMGEPAFRPARGAQPDTVVRWHRQGYKLCWRWKFQTGKVGRPKIELEIRRVIRRMS